ncbi:MAG: hypothetical protein B6D64_10265, partial [Bacteroidetes bacterium 4484_276]
MKNFNNKISLILDQIRQVDNMLLLHKDNNDELMVQQYQARKMDFLKELVSELVNLNASSPRIHKTIKTMIKEIESITPVVSDQDISR